VAKDFNGTTSRITGTLASALNADADFTVGGWFFPDTTGEGTNGSLLALHTAAAGPIVFVGRFATGTDFKAIVVHSTTNADTTTSGNPVATGQWNAVFITYRASDNTCRIYVGDLDTPVAETAYTAQTAGVGTPTAGGVDVVVGNQAALTWTHDGRIEDPFIVPWEMTVAEMERFRHGDRSVLYERGTPTFHALLESTAVDLAPARTALTESSVTTAEGPPVARSWGHE